MAAFVNGVTLFAIAEWIIVEAIRRLRQPPEILGGLMFWIALAGLAVNIVAFFVLARGDRDNLNIRAAVLHVMGDLLGSVAAITAALIIIFTGWTPADPLLSILVSLIILRAAWAVVKDSGRTLLEAAPKDFDRNAAIDRLHEIEGVISIEHVHVWAITEERPMATLEAVIAPSHDADVISGQIKRILTDEFGVGHATVEALYPTGNAEAAARPD